MLDNVVQIVAMQKGFEQQLAALDQLKDQLSGPAAKCCGWAGLHLSSAIACVKELQSLLQTG